MSNSAVACIRLVCALALFISAFSANAFTPPQFQGNVLDETGTLSQQEIAMLEQRIQALRQDGIWAAVYVTKSLQGTSIEEAAVKTFEKWQLGDKKLDNGILVILAPKERKMRIEVGYGLEGEITDSRSKRIVDEIYTPAFRDKQFAAGFMQGFDAMARIMHNESFTPPRSSTTTRPNKGGKQTSLWKIFFGTLVANLGAAMLFLFWNFGWGDEITAERVDSACGWFAFMGLMMGGLAVWVGAKPAGPDSLQQLFIFNAGFDLIILLAYMFNRTGERTGPGEWMGTSTAPSRYRDTWSSSFWGGRSSGSRSGSGSSSGSSGSSSSGGGSSGGGGASGSY